MGENLNQNEPLNVGILIFNEVEVLDFCGPFEVFSVTRRTGVNSQDETNKPFAVFTIAETDRIVRTRGGMLVQPHYNIQNHPPVDILVVPGGWGTRKEVDNPVLIEWLAKISGETQLNTSVCTGAFLLAKTGLLDGHKATTHWLSLDRMEQTFPRVQVIRNTRWVDEGAIISSAGISAGIDMSLHIVERLLGREVAEQTARQMEYSWNEG
ncbi:MAG TPA: DJ-1/PfpI family protein [Chloroflexia bacterium]|nr:DJ-1/PfpI family protein [Chloroflexia bacterium]